MNKFDITWWQIFIGGISTLAIYSFLIKENNFYRFFEHLFIGIAAGISISRTLRTFLWQEFLKPMLGKDLLSLADGSKSADYNNYLLLYLIPMCIGLLYYFILSKRFAWLAQISIGLSLGIGGGLAFKGFFIEIMPQVFDSFKPLFVKNNHWETLSNIVFMFSLITSLSYFFFTFKRKQGGLIEISSNSGRMMMMVCFGAFFGTTIMARMALLVERLQFLIQDWYPNLISVF